MNNTSTLPPSLKRTISQIVGQAFVHDAPEVLAAYECDANVLSQHPPQLVVIPATTEEVARVVKACVDAKVPFIARGSGTGLSGGILAVNGGVCISLSRLNRILEIDAENRTATVQTGVVNAWLNRDASPYGLFYAPDPSSQAACTIGGNVAENSGGIHCAKYGMTVDHILGLTVVTPEGEIVTLGGKHGHTPDVDWVGVFVGSEGTFGIATETIVNLTPVAEKTVVFLAAFSKLSDATDTVSAIIASGLKPAALEFMDEVTVRAVNEAFNTGFPSDSEAVLLIELDGVEAEVAIAEARLVAVLQAHHVSLLRKAESEAERQLFWKARKGAIAAYGRIKPAFYLHDCVIPRSELTNILAQINAIGRKYNVIIANVFHAGDGNLHPNILFDPADANEVTRVLDAGEEMIEACVAVGGMLSGEHGIGVEKAKFMPKVFTLGELEVMGRLKAVFDPEGLSNPGKIFPNRVGCGEARKLAYSAAVEVS